MKKKLLFIYIINLFMFSAVSFASSRKSGYQDDPKEIDRVEMLQSEVQNLILKIENLEHSISVLKEEVAKRHDSDSKPKVPNEAHQEAAQEVAQNDKTNSDDNSVKAKNLQAEGDLSKNEKLPVNNNNNEKTEYQEALICLKEAGAIKIIDEREIKLNEAEEKFKNFIAKYKDSPLLPNAHFWYGEIFFQRKDYNKAAVQYLKSYKISKDKSVTKNNKSPDALLKLGISLGELRKNKDACGILDKLTQEFPKRTEEIIRKEREARIKLGCK